MLLNSMTGALEIRAAHGMTREETRGCGEEQKLPIGWLQGVILLKWILFLLKYLL